MTEQILHETYREVRPAAPVWISDSSHHERRESALLLAWRQAIPGDGRTYWYGLCFTAALSHEQITTSARWVWAPHILAVPNTSDDQSAAWRRSIDEGIRREKAAAGEVTSIKSANRA